MGPDPFSMPSFGSLGNDQRAQMLGQAVSQAAPYATQFHGQLGGPSISQVLPASATPAAPKSGGVLSTFGHWLGGTASQIGHIAKGVGSWLINTDKTMAEAPVKFAYNFGTGAIRSFEESSQEKALTAKQQNLMSLYKDGKINRQQFGSGLQDITNQRDQLAKDLQTTQQRLQASKSEGINTAATLVTLVSGAAGKAVDAALGERLAGSYLSSAGADNFFSAAEAAINKVATNPEAFNALPNAAKFALQKATAEVVANSENMGASQIARSTAVNLALKYPIYYNYLSSTGNQIYNELDQKKYGAAVRQLAFNGVLALSGGPFGWAIDKLGGAAKAVKNFTFGEGSFVDQLSRGIGNGDPQGLVSAIMSLPEADRATAVRQLSALEATNMAAVGKDATAAAMRVIKGMESYEGLSLTQFTHNEALSNMVNFAKAQKLASDTAKSLGMGDITVGRLDARALDTVAINVGQAIQSGDANTVHNIWDALKNENLNQAWANNTNFDRQINNLIDKYVKNKDYAGFDQAVRNINASFEVEGFPKSVSRELAKMGYIPISPVRLEAPFTEGTGKLATKFTEKGGSNFFTHAVQPLPILGHLGDALTSLGLSPNASSERVYQIFTDNLSKNLSDVSSIGHLQGDSAQQTTDTLIKTLSDYAHNPTRGKLMSKAPISDLRMMTTSDIKAALKNSQFDGASATAIQKAIAQSYVQVPLAIRGLGDRAVDLLYRAGPISAVERRYLRVQQAARFAWNPFFHYMRVIPKTEILSTAEGGGYLRSIFAGHYSELNGIVKSLRSGGFLDETGTGILGAEAEASAGETGRLVQDLTTKNLGKKLLPTQEKSIAGLVAAQADRMGMTANEYMTQFPQHVRDTIQMIAEYDKRSPLLNSPLMRTLNVAFFPLRFETKVAQIMGRGLARTSLLTQLAVVNGMMQAHTWLNSPEGQAWYSHNANAIGLFEYITPTAELNQVFNSLLPGHDHSLGNFGELGGLPFGWIPQLIQAEGLHQFNQPGVNAATGQLYSTYIPATSKGQMAIAIQDFLSSIFSYPGAETGLPSKAGITRTVALGLVGGQKKTDLQLTTPPVSSLSMQQQNFVQGIKNANPNNPVINPPAKNEQQFGTPNQTMSGITVPSTAGPLPPGKGGSRGGKTKSTKIKKGQRIPQLLPGQTQLGQL